MSNVYAFAACRFDADTLSLTRNGRAVPVTRQTAEVLKHLLESRDRLVTRAELVDKFWADAPIGADDRLNTCIRRIRTALGENGGPSLIETRPRVGYRFIGDVRSGDRAAPDRQTPRRAATWTGVAASLAATVAVAAIAGAAASARTPDGVYKNDGYELRKFGALSSNCDFDDAGNGRCEVWGDGTVEVYFQAKKLGTYAVTPAARLTCELKAGKAACGAEEG